MAVDMVYGVSQTCRLRKQGYNVTESLLARFPNAHREFGKDLYGRVHPSGYGKLSKPKRLSLPPAHSYKVKCTVVGSRYRYIISPGKYLTLKIRGIRPNYSAAQMSTVLYRTKLMLSE